MINIVRSDGWVILIILNSNSYSIFVLSVPAWNSQNYCTWINYC